MRLLLCFVLLIMPVATMADGFKSQEEAVALTERAMKLAAEGNIRGGLELIRPYSVVPTAEFDSMIGQAELQRPVMDNRFGKSIGYEFVSKKSASPSLARITYLQKFDRHATVWTFTLYNGSEGWVINSFQFVDAISTAF
ncbi:hypothetical protein SAMN05421546_0009 [Solilutibacter tolerans]|uniref:DUF4864 domain-containing protein n=2 Tax=Solilutibacter tolerans TaxID=1604334 RepID=A0A1N6YLG9_9GAMM|nr:hypothetical protein SAMN05421546_0009 [Lysobacter tolerans]